MVFQNEFSKLQHRNRQAIETAILLLSPMAPHICEELWSRFGHTDTLAYHPWPKYDEDKLKVDEVEILIQLNGKPKVRMMIPADADKEQMIALAHANPEVQALVEGRTCRGVSTRRWGCRRRVRRPPPGRATSQGWRSPCL